MAVSTSNYLLISGIQKVSRSNKPTQQATMSLSVSATARLQRQRRLQSCSPVNRALTPASIKRRSRQPNNDENNAAGVSCSSFDEEVTAATTPASDISTPSGDSKQQHGRSFSFSSFSVPFPEEPFPSETAQDASGFISPTNTTVDGSYDQSPSSHWKTPDSKKDSQNLSLVIPSKGRTMSPRNQSPAPSVGALLDSRSRTPYNRPNLSRSNSSHSVPAQGSPKRLLSLTDGHANSNERDAPMDELMQSGRGTRSISRFPPKTIRRPSMELLTDAPPSSTDLVVASSTALVPAPSSAVSSNNLHRMAQALQTNTRPAYLTPDEKHLWDVIHSLLPASSTGSPSTSPVKNGDIDSPGSDWEQKYKQREAEWKLQQEEHDRALRAIQRVLADVTTERDEAVEKLQQDLEQSQQQRDNTILKLTQKLKELTNASSSAEPSSSQESKEEVAALKKQVEELQQKNEELQEGLQTKDSKIATTERALQVAQLSLQDQPDKATRNTLLLELQEDNEQKATEIEKLKSHLHSFKDSANLRKELEEKISSLENAKMIIASLENANGSLAQELRAKLKEKEEELANLTATSADRKKTLDSLATELRDLQKQQQQPNVTKEHLDKQRHFCQFLEKNVKALRQAAVQHEARNDQTSVDRISQIVSETFSSLKHNLESWDSFLKDVKPSEASACDKHLEQALSRKNDETKVLRKELERIRTESNQHIAQLNQEIKSLREQLSTNMEVLAKKGRELSVLRDSLNLDDYDVGYISDDNTEGYDDTETEPATTSSGVFPTSALTIYGGNPNAAETSDAAAAEIQMLRNELVKTQKEREANSAELQAEKESLANAKMIISSLEKANKSMLEDLRSRLQDSNTAIASLLEKSMEHEKSTAALKKELDEVKLDRENDEKKAKADLAKLRDENLVFSMRLAAKDRELEELQNLLSEYEGTEVPMKFNLSSVEEKKEDPAVTDE